ncbi:arylsulfotransferase family protein [Rickettsiales bacterium]|nr:arylsulfotransferase family protein [Rickettsiales bacterium]
MSKIDKFLKYIAVLIYCFLSFIMGILSYNSDFVRSAFLAIANNREHILYGSYSQDTNQGFNVWTEQNIQQHDQLLLISKHFIDNPGLILINNNAEIIHKWNISKEIVNPEIAEKFDLNHSESEVIHAAVDAHLFSNGDVLLINDVREFDNYRGNSLMRIDKDSNVSWQIAGSYHHDLNVAEDGNAYALKFEFSRSFPNIDFTSDNTKIGFANDVIDIVNVNTGKLLNSISVTKAFANSDFAYFLNSFKIDESIGFQRVVTKNDIEIIDILHTNSVQYISKELADVSIFELGDLLISMRGIDTIAVIRPSINKVVWARSGPWRNQHYARLNKDGLIYIYDNDGSAKIIDDNGKIKIKSVVRVLSFNANNEAIKQVFYKPDYMDYYSYWRGFYETLDNGTSLFSSAMQSRIFQIDENGEIIWETRLLPDRDADFVPYLRRMVSVRSYPKDYLNF